MSNLVAVPGAYSNTEIAFTVTNGTAAKILVDVTPAGGGTNGLPLSTVLLGGCRALDCTASSSDASAKDVILYDGTQMTVIGASATGVASITTQNTLNRTTGSWIVDGYRVGSTIMVFAAANAAAQLSDGQLAIVTAVNALTMVVNGTVLTNETLNNGTRICEVSLQFRATIPANAGNSASIPNVALLSNANDATVDRYGVWLGSSGMKIVAMAAAVSALPAYVSINAKIAGY